MPDTDGFTVLSVSCLQHLAAPLQGAKPRLQRPRSQPTAAQPLAAEPGLEPVRSDLNPCSFQAAGRKGTG